MSLKIMDWLDSLSTITSTISNTLSSKASQTSVDAKASQTSVTAVQTTVSAINTRVDTIPTSYVKSIQFGTGLVTSDMAGTITITHSAVNLSKSYFVLDGSGTYQNRPDYASSVSNYISSRTTTSAVLKSQGLGDGNDWGFSWQLIEYY